LPKWLPLLTGMTLFVVVILASILWLMWSGVAGKQRGLVITNLRSDTVAIVFDDGQNATFQPGASQTLVAVKERFPQTVRVTDEAGQPLFTQVVQYQALSEAQFRIAIGDDALLFPRPPTN
jgi:hypothetical protein